MIPQADGGSVISFRALAEKVFEEKYRPLMKE
jgi:hypothetical protein